MSYLQILDLVPQADSVLKLQSRCTYCEAEGLARNALFSLRIAADQRQEVVGGKDIYAAVCRHHYESLSKIRQHWPCSLAPCTRALFTPLSFEFWYVHCQVACCSCASHSSLTWSGYCIMRFLVITLCHVAKSLEFWNHFIVCCKQAHRAEWVGAMKQAQALSCNCFERKQFSLICCVLKMGSLKLWSPAGSTYLAKGFSVIWIWVKRDQDIAWKDAGLLLLLLSAQKQVCERYYYCLWTELVHWHPGQWFDKCARDRSWDSHQSVGMLWFEQGMTLAKYITWFHNLQWFFDKRSLWDLGSHWGKQRMRCQNLSYFIILATCMKACCNTKCLEPAQWKVFPIILNKNWITGLDYVTEHQAVESCFVEMQM